MPPLLDLSFLTTDALFADTFDVTRRPEIVGDDGISRVSEVLYLGQVGAVYPTGSNVLTRQTDDSYSTDTVTIVTKFRLQMMAPGYQPDLVQWDGNTYVVHTVNGYTRYGRGFVEAECTAINNQVTP